jgi:predicted amidohydrolase
MTHLKLRKESEMAEEVTFALAQISAQKGDVAANIQTHLRMIEIAHNYKSDFIIFPELSLTGYEPTLASELAFDLTDHRLEPLREACRQMQITVIAGAPIKHTYRPILGSFVLFPSGTGTVYSKRYLHPGEEQFFAPHDWNPLLVFKGDVLSLAICADILNPLHAKTAHENNSTIYLASVLITPAGYSNDTAVLRKHAREHHMTVMMANYCGSTGGYEAAGESIVIDSHGETIAALDPCKEGILIAQRKYQHEWFCIEP